MNWSRGSTKTRWCSTRAIFSTNGAAASRSRRPNCSDSPPAHRPDEHRPAQSRGARRAILLRRRRRGDGSPGRRAVHRDCRQIDAQGRRRSDQRQAGRSDDGLRLDQGSPRPWRQILGLPGQSRIVRQERGRSHSGMQWRHGRRRHDPGRHGRRLPRADLLEAFALARVQEHEFPEHLFYDVENQIWYAPLPDGTLRTGFTSWAGALMGEVIVFTPKRLGHAFEKDRWFAMVEGGKWIGAARAAFDGIVVAHNELLERKPELLNQDAFGDGWMLIVRPSRDDWREGLVAGAMIASAFE